MAAIGVAHCSWGAVATCLRAWHFSLRSGDRDGADDMYFLKAVTARLAALAEEQKLRVFRREDFFQMMDGLRDKNHFARLRSCSAAPWERWW